MPDYADFRQRLDAVLRTQDVQRVREFLIAEKQWSPDAPADPAFAMWTMIAGSPTLEELRGAAIEWLATHGHAEEAQLFQARQSKPAGKTQGKGGKSGGGKKRR